VKDVRVDSSGAGAPLPPAGQTELPTCPVCLERLDEHISGVVTTVRGRQARSQLSPRPGRGARRERGAGWAAGVQPPLPQRVPAALGRHQLPGVPVLRGRGGEHVALRDLRRLPGARPAASRPGRCAGAPRPAAPQPRPAPRTRTCGYASSAGTWAAGATGRATRRTTGARAGTRTRWSWRRSASGTTRPTATCTA
jgi:hypothetical protein